MFRGLNNEASSKSWRALIAEYDSYKGLMATR